MTHTLNNSVQCQHETSHNSITNTDEAKTAYQIRWRQRHWHLMWLTSYSITFSTYSSTRFRWNDIIWLISKQSWRLSCKFIKLQFEISAVIIHFILFNENYSKCSAGISDFILNHIHLMSQMNMISQSSHWSSSFIHSSQALLSVTDSF